MEAHTRALLICDGGLDEYNEWLVSEGYIVLRIREDVTGRYWLVTFQTA